MKLFLLALLMLLEGAGGGFALAQTVELKPEPFQYRTLQAPKHRTRTQDVTAYFGAPTILIHLPSEPQKWIVGGTSMRPAFGAYANVITVKVPVDDLAVGDIIAYNWPLGNVLHQIIAIGRDDTGWWADTQGIDPTDPMPPYRVRESAVFGVLVVLAP